MPKKPLPPKAEYLAAAEARYDRLTRPPRPVGRPSHRDLDRKAIAETAKINAGVSRPGFELWTQARWVKEVGAFKNETVSGKLTIQKHLKDYLHHTPVPVQLIPVSVVQAKPLNDQLAHWYAMAIVKVLLAAKSSVSLPFTKIDATHRRLCTKHIPKARGLTEHTRHTWLRSR